MPWTPSPPPAHNAGSNYDDYFPWNGLRFALVQLDNESLQILRPTWGCPKGNAQASFVNRWPGSNTGVNTGYTPSPCGAFTGNNFQSNTTGMACPNTNLSQANSSNPGHACIPVKYWSVSVNDTTDCHPGGLYSGFLTMAECIRGEPVATPGSYTTNFSDQCYLCNPSGDSQVCGCGGGQGGWYGYSDAMGLESQDYWMGSHHTNTFQAVANSGKGAYNDTKWYHEISGRDGAGGTSYNIGSYYSVGQTMWDINTSHAHGGFVPHVVSADSNLIYQTETFATDRAASYYAIILFPCYPADAQYDVLNNQFEFKLHQDGESIGWQKVLGSNWSFGSSSAYDTLPPDFYFILFLRVQIILQKLQLCSEELEMENLLV